MRIAFVIASLGAGGAERVTSILTNAWSRLGVDVTVLTVSDELSDFYELSPSVGRIRVGKVSMSTNVWQGLAANFSLVRRLRSALRSAKPDVIISFGEKTNIVALCAAFGTGVPIIISERIDVRYYDIGRIWNALRKLTYRSADVLVLQTKEVAEVFSFLTGVRRVVIPNPVSAVQDVDRGRTLIKRPFVMGMGRLVDQKGFDLLLPSFARISARHPEWTLAIVGDGPDRAKLEAQASELQIARKVVFTGKIRDPFLAVGVPDIFVLSSRFEGFPNALTEAMAHGAPAVSFDCPTGPADVVRHGHDGWLVPAEDTAGLSAAMETLMNDPALREKLSQNARQSVQRFSVSRIAAEWLQLCETLMSPRTKTLSAATS